MIFWMLIEPQNRYRSMDLEQRCRSLGKSSIITSSDSLEDWKRIRKLALPETQENAIAIAGIITRYDIRRAFAGNSFIGSDEDNIRH